MCIELKALWYGVKRGLEESATGARPVHPPLASLASVAARDGFRGTPRTNCSGLACPQTKQRRDLID
jgi:hypothetical protein